MIGIVNYGSGNIGAICNIYNLLKVKYFVSNNPLELVKADSFILPGVGSFDTTMKNLKSLNLVDMLNNEVVEKKKNILGICVGMQLFSSSSEEGKESGLNWISGTVCKLPKEINSSLHILPHMGWNSTQLICRHSLFKDIDLNTGFYFLHNYFYDLTDCNSVITTTNYGIDFASSIFKENIMGVQFHPEKSHDNGLILLNNFSKL
jgi:glutamine amidotransferase